MGSDSVEKKMVKSLKEILHDRSEQEIYAMLKECGMDPDDAVQRLLSQDTFHEVKTKRDRRKEMRDIQGTKSRIGSDIANGGWSSDRDDGRTAVQYNSIAHGTSHYKRENGVVVSSVSNSSSEFQTDGKTTCKQSMHNNSDSFNAESRRQSTGMGSVSLSSERPTKSEPCGPVVGAGRLSVADTVRKGSLCKGSMEFTETSLNRQDGLQTSDGQSVAMNGVEPSLNSDGSREQVTSNGGNTGNTGSKEAASDVPQVSSLEESLPEPTSKDTGSVVLPSHVQALVADCPQLCFGTYNPRLSSTSTELHNSSKINSERLTMSGDGLSAQQLYTNEQFLTETPEPMSTQSTRQQFPYHEQMWEPHYGSSNKKEGVPQYPREMLGLLNGGQGNLVKSTGQSFRADSVHSMHIENPENLITDAFHPFELSPRRPHVNHGLSHQLLGHDYSQQTNTLKQYASLPTYRNVIPPEYGQIPLHQSDGSTKHGLPQYNRDGLGRNMAMPDYDFSGYGRSQGLNTLLGDGLPNSTVASNLSAAGYNNMLRNQILKDTNHFPPHGSVDNGFGAWDYKGSSGAIPTAQENAYYNLLLDQERKIRRQQDQQYSRGYGSPGNFSSYHSQLGISLDNQLLQSFGGITLKDHEDTLPKQHQFWPQARH